MIFSEIGVDHTVDGLRIDQAEAGLEALCGGGA
jgi:hypothetical protein